MKPIDKIFPERQEIMAQKRCVMCGGPATEFKDALSKKEYGISGLCQKCQDDIFKEEDRKVKKSSKKPITRCKCRK